MSEDFITPPGDLRSGTTSENVRKRWDRAAQEYELVLVEGTRKSDGSLGLLVGIALGVLLVGAIGGIITGPSGPLKIALSAFVGWALALALRHILVTFLVWRKMRRRAARRQRILTMYDEHIADLAADIQQNVFSSRRKFEQ